MIIRSSRMQRTYSIAVATESTYYVRVCHIHTRFFNRWLFLALSLSYRFSLFVHLWHPSTLILCLHSSLSLYIILSTRRLSLVSSFLPSLSSTHTNTYMHMFTLFVFQVLLILSISSCVQQKDTVILHSFNHASIN